MARAAATAPLRRIGITGGTHGNETNGVFVVDGFRRGKSKEPSRSSFTDVILCTSNPGAVKQVQRFLDEDLNRQFGLKWLRDPERPSYEAQRAKAINQLLGPKPGSFDDLDAPMPVEDPDAPVQNGAVDFGIDFHTTTSSMGCTFIVTGLDKVSLSAAVYARAWMDSQGIPAKISYIGIPRAEQPWVVSTARHGVIIECGPTPWGLLRHDIVHWMRESTRRLLDYVDARNRGVAPPLPPAGTWGKGWVKEGGGAAMPTRVTVNTAIIDPAKNMPAKIPVPTDENGRAAVMFHPQLQGSDWQPLRKGDPMFLGFDGEVIPYGGEYGDVVHPLFINEAAYFLPSSGLGFELSVEKEIACEPPLPVATDARL